MNEGCATGRPMQAYFRSIIIQTILPYIVDVYFIDQITTKMTTSILLHAVSVMAVDLPKDIESG